MEPSLRFDYRDIVGAPARALSAKRILVMTLYLCVGMAVYDLFTYTALAVDGEPLGSYWSVYGLFPIVWLKMKSFGAVVLYGVGIAFGLLSLMLGFFAVSTIEIEQVRGNRFLSTKEAIRFSWQRFTQLLISEISIAAFVAFIILLILLLGLVTRIPFVGEWIYALTFLVPGFVIAMFTLFIIVILHASIILLPAVVAAERTNESFSAVLMTFSTIIRQPTRWLLYTAYGFVTAKLASFAYAYFCYRAVQFFAVCTSWTAGDKAINIIRSGLSHLPVNSDLVRETTNIFPGVDWSFSFAVWARGGGNEPVGYLMAFVLFLIFMSVIGYALAIVATVQARTFVIIRHIADEYEIADEKPLFLEEEHANEPEGDGGNPENE